MNKQLIINTLHDAISALSPYAEAPTKKMEDYRCHKGICDMWACERCSNAIHAYGTILSIDYALAELIEKDDYEYI
jgi:hypothetical protein